MDICQELKKSGIEIFYQGRIKAGFKGQKFWYSRKCATDQFDELESDSLKHLICDFLRQQITNWAKSKGIEISELISKRKHTKAGKIEKRYAIEYLEILKNTIEAYDLDVIRVEDKRQDISLCLFKGTKKQSHSKVYLEA